MKQWLLFLIAILFFISLGISAYFGYQYYRTKTGHGLSLQSLPTPEPTPKPLEKFTFDNLSQRSFEGDRIEIGDPLNAETELTDGYKSSIFYFTSDGKRVSGQINIPIPTASGSAEATDSAQIAGAGYSWTMPENGKLPVIVMLRGYVDRQQYETGIGTKRVAAVLAQNGYITLAPDFLGYGRSDMPLPACDEDKYWKIGENDRVLPEPNSCEAKADVWWERFNNPVQVLNLLASLKNLPQADPDKVGLWAHSNGGQIALSVLEISKREIPTTLWAPVTKPFPFAILFFTDEFEDEGKALRAEVARLERDYDVRKYSITDYFDRIEAPLLIHQGTADEAVPLKWTNDFVKKLKDMKKPHTYYKYPEADHNLAGSWNKVVERDLVFFEKHLRNTEEQ